MNSSHHSYGKYNHQQDRIAVRPSATGPMLYNNMIIQIN
uniref:Uncharacterized protein n=1 Tax=Anguilla anguilla TaxID=7936 RepID=A0A0E9PJF4_ANGAN